MWKHQGLMELQRSSQVVPVLVKKYATYPAVVERHKAMACRAADQGRDEDSMEHQGTGYRAQQGAHSANSMCT